ncbi:unnamed protein product [Caenorhabditis brenneri]
MSSKTSSTVSNAHTTIISSSSKKTVTSTKSIGTSSSIHTTTTSTPSRSQSQTVSKPSVTSAQSSTSKTSPSSKSTGTSRSTPTTTTDPKCSRQCPDGYLVGTSSCFLLVPASQKISSYQGALSHCKTTELQTLASMDKIRDNADIKLIQESAGLKGLDLFYANGIGGHMERFEKLATVYSIYSQSLTSSPTVRTVGISETFPNISALCVLPQYCNKNECDVEKLFLAYNYYTSFKTSAGTLQPKGTGRVTCLYGNKKTTTVTCNSLGAIYPNPTNIDCQEGLKERLLKDTTNETVSSCKVCYGRGTKECQEVLKENGDVEGYRCVCREPYYMICTCNWGYSGERCEKSLRDEFFKDFGYSSVTGATITVGEMLLKLAKIAVLGYSLSSAQGSDPQDTHQRLRTFCTVAAGFIMTMWSNPTVFGITQSACRFYFIALHFFYMLGMMQWVFEGWNVNQVLRGVHLNEWEVDFHGNRPWGVRLAARMVLSAVGIAVYLLITFQTGWYKLAASWTCVGVICQANLSVWLPMFALVGGMILFAAAILESSTLIYWRRPLLAYKIDMKIERDLGFVQGQRVNKCRDNANLSFIGLVLLAIQWIMVVISSDYRDDIIFGFCAVASGGVYSLFCSYQEIWTNPEERGKYLQLMQRYWPQRWAPDYNRDTTWTFAEVREHFALPKAEREAVYESFLSRNQKLMMHHRWDLRMNHFLAQDHKMSVNDALIKVFTEEMNRLKANRGTVAQKKAIQQTYGVYMDSIPHTTPREAGRLKGRLELVTLAAEDDQNIMGVKIARFFIVPRFHTFEPEIPEKGDSKINIRNRNHKRKLMETLEADIYQLARDEALAQTTFIKSAIHFMNYGNKVVR